MAELKTKPTGASVTKFLNAIDDDRRRKDCRALAAIMQKATKARPKMWGPGIVGYAKDPETAKRLGKFKTGGSCLYIKSLDDLHVPTLRALIAASLKRVKSGRIDYSA